MCESLLLLDENIVSDAKVCEDGESAMKRLELQGRERKCEAQV